VSSRRAAFSRAETFLDFSAGWKWGARAAGIGAALVTLGLFITLTLFVELLLNRGQVPEYSQLRPSVQQHYETAIAEMSSADRRAMVESFVAGPVPAAAGAYPPPTPAARELLWRASVTDLIRQRVGTEAAELYRVTAADPDGRPASLGLLGVAVRQPGALQRVFMWFASWNPWTWRPAGGNGPNTAYLVGLTVIGIILAVIRSALLNMMNFAAATATLDAATRLRRAVYHHSYRLGTLALREDGSNEAVSIFTRHVQNVHDALYARLTTLFYEPILLAVLVAFALFLDFWLALSWVLLAAVVILLGGYLAARFRDRARAESRRAAGQLALLQESLTLMRLVKSNLMEVFNQSRVERQLSDFSRASFRSLRNESLFGPLLVFLGTVSAAMVLLIAGVAVLYGGIGPGRLALLVVTLVCAYWPLQAILAARRVVRRGRDSAVPLFQFLDRPGETGQVVGAEFLAGVEHGIEFRSVNLREPGTGRLLLDDLSFRIRAGQRVAFVGSDDGEKHAIVYMLLRYLDATTGDILIDDKSLRGLTLESLRAQIGLVLWNSLIFNDTVAHNIGCGDPSVTLPQIIDCAKIAHAHQFVQRLPYGYETPIGEMGVSLRASERFRVALARAILKDPSIYIIEEPQTPFDDETKAMIDDTLSRVLEGKTTIFLAHRISTIRSCDRVYLIHDGQLKAAGEHRELLSRSELYKHLHYLEFNEFAGKT